MHVCCQGMRPECWQGIYEQQHPSCSAVRVLSWGISGKQCHFNLMTCGRHQPRRNGEMHDFTLKLRLGPPGIILDGKMGLSLVILSVRSIPYRDCCSTRRRRWDPSDGYDSNQYMADQQSAMCSPVCANLDLCNPGGETPCTHPMR